MKTADLVKELQKQLEIPDAIPSSSFGVWQIFARNQYPLYIADKPPGYSFQCTFCEYPSNNQEEFFTKALAANLFGQSTLGSVLGLDAEGKRLTLNFENRSGGDYKQFEKDLEAFFDAIDHWHDKAIPTEEK